MDMTPEARIRSAERVVREQRRRGVTMPEYAKREDLTPAEVFYLDALTELQRAVMGQPEPGPPDAAAILAAWPRYADGQTLRLPRP